MFAAHSSMTPGTIIGYRRNGTAIRLLAGGSDEGDNGGAGDSQTPPGGADGGQGTAGQSGDSGSAGTGGQSEPAGTGQLQAADGLVQVIGTGRGAGAQVEQRQRLPVQLLPRRLSPRLVGISRQQVAAVAASADGAASAGA